MLTGPGPTPGSLPSSVGVHPIAGFLQPGSETVSLVGPRVAARP
jgi:hypothetical protein